MAIDPAADRMTSSHTVPGAPEDIRADIENTRADLADTVTALTGKVNPRTRLRGALSNMKTKAAAGTSRVQQATPQQVRRARQAVQSRPVPVAAATALTAAGTVAAVLISRRRAAKARAARNRWLPGFLHR
ncbi:DUF3618 domain-containing protein [Actinoplanes sp. NPDC051859]|uniref:DUF3618 domain-containing protein n=1 Tax=Actinoplanes sp. NPDC051859 TaxID=3363909 RepID=UPI003798D30F